MQRLETERRREEREHEVKLLQMMMQMKSSVAPHPGTQQYQPNATSYALFSGDTTQMMGCISTYSHSSSDSYTSDDGNTYYNL